MSAHARNALLFVAALAAAASHAAAQVAFGPTPDQADTPYLQADTPYLQAARDVDPAELQAVGTQARRYYTPNWYARGGVTLLFPQDLTFDNVAQQNVPSADPDVPGFTVEPVGQDLTLGWGGGLFVAAGYGFRPDTRFNPRVEAEYMLLIDDYRGTNDRGITWNSLAVNGIIDWRVRERLAFYGGAGIGLAYITFSNPAVTVPNVGNVSVGGDDGISPFGQVLGGTLIRFSDDIEIDLGIRYQYANPDAFDGDVDFNNVVFTVGLLLRLE